MGIYKNGVLGTFSGKVGNVVGSNWRSIEYMRTRPKPSGNKIPSEKQKQIRSKFTTAVEFINPFRELLEASYSERKGSKKSPFELAMANVLSSIKGSHPNFTIDYQNIQFSRGTLSPVRGTFSTDKQHVLNFSWKPKRSIGTAEDNDIVYIIMYDSLKNISYIFSEAERVDGKMDILIEVIGKGTFQVWTFTSTHDYLRFSNTLYYGSLEI